MQLVDFALFMFRAALTHRTMLSTVGPTTADRMIRMDDFLGAASLGIEYGGELMASSVIEVASLRGEGTLFVAM